MLKFSKDEFFFKEQNVVKEAENIFGIVLGMQIN
jgi:hypothetical protein